MEPQRLGEAVVQRDHALGGFRLSLGHCGLIAFRKRRGAADGDRLLHEVHIPVHIQVDDLAPAQSGKEHCHGADAEVVFRIRGYDQILLPSLQAPMFSGGAFRRLGQLCRAPDDHTILHSCPEDSPDRAAELGDITVGSAGQCIVQALDVRCVDRADCFFRDGSGSVFDHFFILLPHLPVASRTVDLQPFQAVIQEGNLVIVRVVSPGAFLDVLIALAQGFCLRFTIEVLVIIPAGVSSVLSGYQCLAGHVFSSSIHSPG